MSELLMVAGGIILACVILANLRLVLVLLAGALVTGMLVMAWSAL